MDKDKKAKPKPPMSWWEIDFIIIIAGLVIVFGSLFSQYFNGNLYEKSLNSYHTFLFYLINFYSRYVVFAIFFSIILMIFMMIYSRRYDLVKQKMMKKIVPDDKENSAATETEVNPKWLLVEEHINSDDLNKWKLAIIEADIILSDLLNTLNLPGDTIGEKLKAVEESDFNTLNDAWEAHKERNKIAHEGSDHDLNQREAKRIINLYRNVFNEFDMI